MSKTFLGGVPTDVDIKKIQESYPGHQLVPGTIIPYHEIENLLREKRWFNRFKGVTNRWRKIVEEETGHIIGTKPGEGFKVLEDAEKVDMSGSKLRSAARFAKRSYTVASRVITSNLSEEDRYRLDFNIAKSSKVIAAAQVRSKKNLLPDLETQ